MPLPVERSQGSVSALVARFQTAANRDAEATARESRRASLQPSLNNSRRTSSVWSSSPANTPKLGETAVLPDQDVVEKDKKDDKSARVEESSGVKGVLDKVGDTLNKVENRLENLVLNDSDKKEVVDESPKKDFKIDIPTNNGSPSRPPKSPKRLSSTNVMSALPIPDTVPAAGSDAEVGRNDQAQDDSGQNGRQTEQKIKAAKVDTPLQVKTKAPSRSTPAAKTPSSQLKSNKKSTQSPSTTTKPLPNTSTPKTNTPNPNTKTRTRLSSGPSTSPSTTTPTARSRTSLGHQTPTSSRKSTIPPPLPPSSTRTPKPLVPSHTGPARRPLSSAQNHTRSATDTGLIQSPLKPHLTGTPSKPTASSLAKARIPSGQTPSTPNSGITSTTKKRESTSLSKNTGSTQAGLAGRGNSLSPSPSPASTTTTKNEGTPSKSTGSGTGSRLLQGTAASRARSADIPHHDLPSSTPTSTSSTNKTPSNTTNTPSKITSTQNRRTPSSSSTSTSRVRVKSTQSASTDTQTPVKNFPKTASVGKSPIGRLGLAAANIHRPEGPHSGLGEKAIKDGVTSAAIEDEGKQGKIEDENVPQVEDDKVKVESNAKEELNDITFKSDDGSKEKTVEDPIERPRTPSPTLDPGTERAVPKVEAENTENKSNGLTDDAKEDVPHSNKAATRSEDVKGSVLPAQIEKEDLHDHKNVSETGLEVGEESLEEIPDIE